MTDWQKTGCILCAQNCGLEVQITDNQIVRVRPDKDNPRSKGYGCRKGRNIANHQHHDDRLTVPLKKTAGGFVPISWEQALTEIGAKLKTIVAEHGPKSFAYMGGGGQGCHFEAAFGLSLMRALGSHYYYNALAQELTGFFWVSGRMIGRQNRFPIPHEEEADMLVAVGWNGMVSHQMVRAPLVLKEFAKNPGKKLVVVDPRRSETAKMANLHLPIKPGTDALFWRAVIAMLFARGLVKEEKIRAVCTGFDEIKPWFTGFDVEKALAVCGLSRQDVDTLVTDLGTRKWCMHFDLGIHMNRHSTLAAYLLMLLAALCDRFCTPGGQVIPGYLMPLGSHSDERNAKTWRTVATDFPPISGVFPPNVMPEEILNSHPERLRAVICSASNPLRSYADTSAYEKAFTKLDLLVVIELAMTETAELADYVLPARSGYESYNGTFFPWTFPEVYFQLRRPLLEPLGEPRESGAIMAGIARAAGLLPELPDWLTEAARQGEDQFAAALFIYLTQNKKAKTVLPLLLAETLGQKLGSANFAALWGLITTLSGTGLANAERAGFSRPHWLAAAMDVPRLLAVFKAMLRHRSPIPLALLSPRMAQSRKLFHAIKSQPQGLFVGKLDAVANVTEICNKDGKIHLYIEELEAWMAEITPEMEERLLRPDPLFPLLLQAGRHTPENANTLMRKPDWNVGRRACTLAINPTDAQTLAIVDGEQVLVTTATGSAHIEAEITDETRPGQVIIPHGFGLKYLGQVNGVNVNSLTAATWRDRLAATPYHKYVCCRVEKIADRIVHPEASDTATEKTAKTE